MKKFTKSIINALTLVAFFFAITIESAQAATRLTPAHLYNWARTGNTARLEQFQKYINLHDQNRNTALCLAQRAKDRRSYSLLLDYGASTDVECHDDNDKVCAIIAGEKTKVHPAAFVLLGLGAAAGAYVLLDDDDDDDYKCLPQNGEFSSRSDCEANNIGYTCEKNSNNCYIKGGASECPVGYSTAYQSAADCGNGQNPEGWIYESNDYSGELNCGKCTAKTCTIGTTSCDAPSAGFVADHTPTGALAGDEACLTCNYNCDSANGYYDEEPTCQEGGYICSKVTQSGKTCYFRSGSEQCPTTHPSDTPCEPSTEVFTNGETSLQVGFRTCYSCNYQCNTTAGWEQGSCQAGRDCQQIDSPIACYKDNGCPSTHPYTDEEECKKDGWNCEESAEGSGCFAQLTAVECPTGYETDYQSVTDCGSTGAQGYNYTTSGKSGGQVCGKCEERACDTGSTEIKSTSDCSVDHPQGYEINSNVDYYGETPCNKCEAKTCEDQGYVTDFDTQCPTPQTGITNIGDSSDNVYGGENECYKCAYMCQSDWYESCPTGNTCSQSSTAPDNSLTCYKPDGCDETKGYYDDIDDCNTAYASTGYECKPTTVNGVQCYIKGDPLTCTIGSTDYQTTANCPTTAGLDATSLNTKSYSDGLACNVCEYSCLNGDTGPWAYTDTGLSQCQNGGYVCGPTTITPTAEDSSPVTCYIRTDSGECIETVTHPFDVKCETSADYNTKEDSMPYGDNTCYSCTYSCKTGDNYVSTCPAGKECTAITLPDDQTCYKDPTCPADTYTDQATCESGGYVCSETATGSGCWNRDRAKLCEEYGYGLYLYDDIETKCAQYDGVDVVPGEGSGYMSGGEDCYGCLYYCDTTNGWDIDCPDNFTCEEITTPTTCHKPNGCSSDGAYPSSSPCSAPSGTKLSSDASIKKNDISCYSCTYSCDEITYFSDLNDCTAGGYTCTTTPTQLATNTDGSAVMCYERTGSEDCSPLFSTPCTENEGTTIVSSTVTTKGDNTCYECTYGCNTANGYSSDGCTPLTGEVVDTTNTSTYAANNTDQTTIVCNKCAYKCDEENDYYADTSKCPTGISCSTNTTTNNTQCNKVNGCDTTNGWEEGSCQEGMSCQEVTVSLASRTLTCRKNSGCDTANGYYNNTEECIAANPGYTCSTVDTQTGCITKGDVFQCSTSGTEYTSDEPCSNQITVGAIEVDTANSSSTTLNGKTCYKCAFQCSSTYLQNQTCEAYNTDSRLSINGDTTAAADALGLYCHTCAYECNEDANYYNDQDDCESATKLGCTSEQIQTQYSESSSITCFYPETGTCPTGYNYTSQTACESATGYACEQHSSNALCWKSTGSGCADGYTSYTDQTACEAATGYNCIAHANNATCFITGDGCPTVEYNYTDQQTCEDKTGVKCEAHPNNSKCYRPNPTGICPDDYPYNNQESCETTNNVVCEKHPAGNNCWRTTGTTFDCETLGSDYYNDPCSDDTYYTATSTPSYDATTHYKTCYKCTYTCSNGSTAGLTNCSNKTYSAGWNYSSSTTPDGTTCGICTAKACTTTTAQTTPCDEFGDGESNMLYLYFTVTEVKLNEYSGNEECRNCVLDCSGSSNGSYSSEDDCEDERIDCISIESQDVYAYSSYTNKKCYYPYQCKPEYTEGLLETDCSASETYDGKTYTDPVSLTITCGKCTSTCDNTIGEYDTQDACETANSGFSCTLNEPCYTVSGCTTGTFYTKADTLCQDGSYSIYCACGVSSSNGWGISSSATDTTGQYYCLACSPLSCDSNTYETTIPVTDTSTSSIVSACQTYSEYNQYQDYLDLSASNEDPSHGDYMCILCQYECNESEAFKDESDCIAELGSCTTDPYNFVTQAGTVSCYISSSASILSLSDTIAISNTSKIEITSTGTEDIYGIQTAENVANTTSLLNGEVGSINITHNSTGSAYGMYGTSTNTLMNTTGASINIQNNSTGSATGMYVSTGGKAYNSGDINITGSTGTAIGIYGEGQNTIKNSGNINVSGTDAYGIYVKDGTGTTVTNTETGNITVNAANEAHGIYIHENSADAVVENKGTITINGEVKDGSSGITLNGATLKNYSLLRFTDTVDLNALGGKVYLEDGGVYEAESLSGELNIGTSTVTGENKDTYVNKNSIIADSTDNLNLVSESALFTAQKQKSETSDGYDVVMTRKDFGEFTPNTSIKAYLESNYKDGELVELFDNVKSETSAQGTAEAFAEELGYDVMPNFADENFIVMKSLNRNIADTILKPTDEANRVVAGYDYISLETENKALLSGADLSANSMYTFGDKRLDNKNRLGLGLSFTELSSSYEKGGDRDVSIISIFMPYLHKFSDKLRLASILSFGYGTGEFERSSNNESDISDIFYGFTNELRYTIDLNGFAELEPALMLNAIGYTEDGFDEGNGENAIETKKTHNLSVEAGVGLFLKKEVKTNEHGKIGFRIGGAYYRELGNPYDKIDARLKRGNSSWYRIDDYANLYDHDRAILEAAIDYEYKSIGVYAKYNRLIQKNNPELFDLGIKYKF